METFIIATFALLLILTAAMLVVGQKRHWGLTPVGLLGLGFVIPFLMLLGGAL